MVMILATILAVGVVGCGGSIAAGNPFCEAFANDSATSTCSRALSEAILALKYPTPHSTAVTSPQLISGGIMSLREFEDDVLRGRSESNPAIVDRSQKRWVFLFSGTSYPIIAPRVSTDGVPSQYDFVLIAVDASTLDLATQIYIRKGSLDQFGVDSLEHA